MNAPWDFDLSYGNASDKSEAGNMIRTHRWFARLAEDPLYFNQYVNRFDELRPLFLQIPEILETNYQFLKTTGVLEREKGKWPQILAEFSPESSMTKPTDYHAHVRYLSDWIALRDAWCYIELGKTDEEKAERLKKTKPVIRILGFENMENKKTFNVKILQSEKDNNTYKYIWNNGISTINPVKSISSFGKYWVKIMDNKGNLSLASDTLYFGVQTPTSTDQPEVGTAFTYNNPASDQILIHYNTENSTQLSVSLWDIRGSKILENNFTLIAGYNQLSIPANGLQRGIYIIRIQSGNQHFSGKIILK